jgi:hypothetical protein
MRGFERVDQVQTRAPPAPRNAPRDYVDAKKAESERRFPEAENLYRRVIAQGGYFRDSAVKDLAGLFQTQKRTKEAIQLLESFPSTADDPDVAREHLLEQLYTALRNADRNRDCARVLLVEVSSDDFVINRQTLPRILRNANGIQDIRYFNRVPGPKAIVEFNSVSAARRVINKFREAGNNQNVQVVWAPYETQFALDPEDIFPSEESWDESMQFTGREYGRMIPPANWRRPFPVNPRIFFELRHDIIYSRRPEIVTSALDYLNDYFNEQNPFEDGYYSD